MPDQVHKETVFKQIGAKIIYYRKLRELTQEELAGLSHISSSTLGKIERGKYNHNVSVAVLIDIAYGLGIDFSTLFDFNEVEKEMWIGEDLSHHIKQKRKE